MKINIKVEYIPVEYRLDKLGDFECEHVDTDIEAIGYWDCGDSFSGPYRDYSEEMEEVCTSCQAVWRKYDEKWVKQW